MHHDKTAHIISCLLPTQWGEFRLCALDAPYKGEEHIALTMGVVDDGKPVLTRVHSECLTGDCLYSLRCDCGAQLQAAMKAIAAGGRGVIIYLRHEGRGIGLTNKIRAYALQEKGADTVEANRLLGFGEDMRDYTAAKILLDALGISAVHLMTNNPKKIEALQSMGINVVSRIPLHVGQNSHNQRYLETKVEKMGHIPVE
jgi:GTP cyclohydrolase II